jgi:hypothetical protein
MRLELEERATLIFGGCSSYGELSSNNRSQSNRRSSDTNGGIETLLYTALKLIQAEESKG